MCRLDLDVDLDLGQIPGLVSVNSLCKHPTIAVLDMFKMSWRVDWFIMDIANLKLSFISWI